MRIPALMTTLLALTLATLLGGCADSRSVNAAFSQVTVSWSVFDPAQDRGLRDLPGFEQPVKVVWGPRPEAVRATDLLRLPGGSAAVAVSRLGLLIVDDSSGPLEVIRPGSLNPLELYQTGPLFLWQDKLFLTLFQGPGGKAPPATLVWWAPGQPRVAPLPIPTQVRDPLRQAVEVGVPLEGSSEVTFHWSRFDGTAWDRVQTVLSLDTGVEAPRSGPLGVPAGPPDAVFAPVIARLHEKLGASTAHWTFQGSRTVGAFTSDGWVALGVAGTPSARLYKLPELGAAGRYTGAVALSRGYLFTWETFYRGYAGAAGLVHVPAAVLAP